MSNKERAIELLEQIPESKMFYVLAFLEGVSVPDETPNMETLDAFEEGDKMLSMGTGKKYTNTKDLFADLEG